MIDIEKMIREVAKDAIQSFAENNPQIANRFFDSIRNKEIISEMPISQKDMAEKYAEVIGVVVDNLVCICLYPSSPTVSHWRERACGLCKRFVDLNISPLKKNNSEFRYRCLNKALMSELDADFGAVANHFRSVSAYYAKKADPKERLFPYKPYDKAYGENKERIENAVIALTRYVAEQDYSGMIDYMENF